jgi:hypothetical protein
MFSLVSLIIPNIAFAAGEITLSVKDIMYRISYYVINPVIQVGFAISLLYFVWTIIMYIKNKNSGRVFTEGVGGAAGKWGGQNGIIDILWGLFGLFIMTSAFVIMQIIAKLIGSDIPTP